MMRRYRLGAGLVALALLHYGLGLAVAAYLGVLRAQPLAWEGGLWLLLLVSGAFVLAEARPEGRKAQTPEARRLLVIGFVFLAAAALTTTVLGWQGALSPTVAWLQALLAVVALAVGVPAWRQRLAGYEECLLAAALALLAPALAFALQTAALHRLLGMVGLPLCFLNFAARLLWDFPLYARQRRRGRRSLLMRLDWRLAFRLHNLALLTGFLLLALDGLLGLPWEVLWPCVVPLAAALVQVWLVHRVGEGARPLWPWLRANAWLIVVLTAYFLALGFWSVGRAL